MTSPVYLIDAASFQGAVNWALVDQACAGGFEKVTEGTNYVNPFWPSAKKAMAARHAADGFVCGAYLFLDASPGAAQADWFAQHAGNLDGWAIAIDVERAQGEPTLGEAEAAVARLRQHYPHHPIVGYIPHWYWVAPWSSPPLPFIDLLWASSYVSGTGHPKDLYPTVPAALWAAYGGHAPTLLQFTSSATVQGVSGKVDCSAFRGDQAQLRAAIVGAPAVKPPPSPPPHVVTEEAYLVPISPQGVPYKVTRVAGTKPWQ